MNSDLTLHTRREFLRKSMLGGALSASVPAFLAHTFSALETAAADQATQATTGREASILVILQLAGGNDGLNTLVPHANDFYRQARPKLGLTSKEVLKLNDELGLNPNLAGFKELYDAGQMSVIQGIGYPNPNRSHFRSTEIWQTASDAEKYENYGWLGRYFDNACAGAEPTVGLSIGRQTPQAFAAKMPRGISLENPESYRFISSPEGQSQGQDASENSYRRLNEGQEMMSQGSGTESDSGASIGSLHGPTHHGGSVLDFLERTALDAQLSSDRILEVSKKGKNTTAYPASQLASSLKLVARLIAGGLPTRVYYVSQGGYDTHTNQAGAHPRLLRELGDSVKAFMGDLQGQGNLPRVALMTFSEFGRRVAENASGGTDHGAAAPMFICGGKVKAGLFGQGPSLAPTDLVNGDLAFNVDFRSVYAGLLEGWLKTPSEPILGRPFSPLFCV